MNNINTLLLQYINEIHIISFFLFNLFSFSFFQFVSVSFCFFLFIFLSLSFYFLLLLSPILYLIELLEHSFRNQSTHTISHVYKFYTGWSKEKFTMSSPKLTRNFFCHILFIYLLNSKLLLTNPFLQTMQWKKCYKYLKNLKSLIWIKGLKTNFKDFSRKFRSYIKKLNALLNICSWFHSIK